MLLLVLTVCDDEVLSMIVPVVALRFLRRLDVSGDGKLLLGVFAIDPVVLPFPGLLEMLCIDRRRDGWWGNGESDRCLRIDDDAEDHDHDGLSSSLRK